MTWKVEKVARLEAANGHVQVTGVEGYRHCGCRWLIGTRLDTKDATFGVFPCEEHGAASERAFETLTKMPPSDEEVIVLWQRLVDAEIEPWRAQEAM